MKVRKRLVKQVAKIYAAGLLYHAMGSGASADELTEDENDLLQSYVKEMALKIHPEAYSDLNDIVDTVLILNGYE